VSHSVDKTVVQQHSQQFSKVNNVEFNGRVCIKFYSILNSKAANLSSCWSQN